MATVDEARKALAKTVSSGAGIRCNPYNPAKVSPPGGFIGTHESNLLDTDGTRSITFSLWIVVEANHISKQQKLDDALTAAVDAIDEEPGLGRAQDDVCAACSPWEDYGDVTIAGSTLWGARIPVEILFS
jgi:hypothetical protein